MSRATPLRSRHASSRENATTSITLASPVPSLRLIDGRTLSYAEYGASDGRPLLLFHGTPGSRLDFRSWDAPLRAHGLRGIAIDRPGMGQSSFQRSRSLVDWPQDVAQLMNHLNLEQVTVLGASGGGPHALVCGALLADRTERIVLLCSAFPVDTPAFFEGMSRANRIGFRLGRLSPLLMAGVAVLQRSILQGHPEWLLKGLRRNVGPEDAARLVDMSADVLKEEWLEAYGQGVQGVVAEARIHSHPWGFAPEAVAVPVTLWHGQQDRLAPMRGVEQLAWRLPQATLRVLKGHGHLLDLYPGTLDVILSDIGASS